MAGDIKSKIGFSSRYYESFRFLKASVASQNVFRLIHNEDKGTYSFPYLYGDYKNELDPILISNRIINSVKYYLEVNLFSSEEKKFLLNELIPYVENFGNDTIDKLTTRINLAGNKEEHSQIVAEYKKTIISLTKINEILNNEFTNAIFR